MDWGRLAERLKTARARAGVELGALARAADVPLEVLTELEAGRQAKVTTAALARVERELHVPEMSLWWGEIEKEPAISVHFLQSGVPDFHAVDEEAAREALSTAAVVRDLDRLSGTRALHWYFSSRAPGAKPWSDGYERAAEVRRALVMRGLIADEAAPLSLPLDQLVEDEFGIPVLEETLATPSVVALTAKADDLAAVILNTATQHMATPLGRRVVVAHELCHVLFDQPKRPLDLWIEREVEGDGERQGEPVEQRARAFAAELLVPLAGLRKLLGPVPSEQASLQLAADRVRRTVEAFAATPRTVALHLSNHGYIPEFLKEDAAKTAVVAPDWANSGVRELLPRRVRSALRAGAISTGRAREILGLGPWDDPPWDAP